MAEEKKEKLKVEQKEEDQEFVEIRRKDLVSLELR